MTAKLITQFNARLDRLLGLNPNFSKTNDLQIEAELQVASLLDEMDFDAELAPRADIRSRWTQQAQRSSSNRSTRQLLTLRWTWIFILVILLALLVAFRQPVFAAVSRMFGYIYISDVGFLPMDSTLMLEQPIIQEHNGQTITVMRGVATSENVILFLEFNDIARPVDGAWLEASSGERLELLQWQYWPNMPKSRGIQMIFPPLPSGITQTTLALPEGWHLPLTWIPASQSKLPDVRAVPYAEQPPVPSAPAKNLCIEKNGMNLCMLAAITSAENTSVLIQAQSTNPQLIAGTTMQGLTWQTETEQVKLTDEQGNALPMNGERNGTLTFPPLAGNQKMTLSIPALLASVDIPDQSIVVDVGDNPQPDTIIPLDVNIQVLNTTVHFSQATFVGDGVGSLRLTLNADEPIQTIDGITPASLEMGKPDKVEDLYGGGMLAGSKDIFIELIHPNEKITGVINIPIINATVIVDGPFEFTFNLTDASSPAPTPAQADPNIFSPAPTPTPIPLDGYSYRGMSLNSGDLLYTLLNGDKTNIFAISPDGSGKSNWLATLPGSVSQIYIHPDCQGMDYLAGVSKVQDDVSYIDNIRLYTLRFAEPLPRLLFSFTPNAANLVGTAVEGNWSYDGRFALFRLPGGSAPGSAGWRYVWLDLSCRESGICTSQEIPLNSNLELYRAYFAPTDYRILFTGSDYSGTGKTDIFLLDFDPDHPEKRPVNLTASFSVGDGITAATWASKEKVFTLCSETLDTEATAFCWLDPQTGEISFVKSIKPHFDGMRLFGGYWLSPSGDKLAAILFPENALWGDALPELRLLDWNGHSSIVLSQSLGFSYVDFSPSGKYIAYISMDKARLEIFNLLTNTGIPITTMPDASAFSWLGWIR